MGTFQSFVNIGTNKNMSLPFFIVFFFTFLLQLFLITKTLENIISTPLVQKSKESNTPSWLLLPTLSCMVIGSLYAFSDASVLNTRNATKATWIGPLFMIAGGT